MTTESYSFQEIPNHLKPYVSMQHYNQYSPIDHAVWRYVMRQNHHFLKDVAHPAYVQGLQSSGINIQYLPKVEEMNACLSRAGWGAVTIDGLIPSAAFFGFQGYGILPIATDIRKVQNIEYTPAPDIIHEAAGHAPILFDETYAAYIKMFGEIGSKAFATKEEHDVFDAIRNLTIVMESRTSTEEEIEAAKALIEERQKEVQYESEILQISRLFWWTVEYGLIGDMNNPKIYGAGLLSSVGESKHCLTDAVKKIPFSVAACIQTDYDVTVMQPQLFVCQSFDELIQELDAFANTLALRKGGTESLEKAIRSGAVATAVFSSGLQVSGILSSLIKDGNGEAVYMRTEGPTTLAIDDKQLPAHGKNVHASGFGTPIGMLAGNIALETCTDEELRQLHIVVGENTTLQFASGVTVCGTVKNIQKHDGKIALISFNDCTVKLGEDILFEEAWGTFDMAVGATITSVFAGAADPETFFDDFVIEQTTPTPRTWSQLEQMYQSVRSIREEGEWSEKNKLALSSIIDTLQESYEEEWLLRLELVELLPMFKDTNKTVVELTQELQQLSENESVRRLIYNGLALLNKEVVE